MVQNYSSYIKKFAKKRFLCGNLYISNILCKSWNKEKVLLKLLSEALTGLWTIDWTATNQMTISFNKLPWLPGVEYPRISGASLSLGAWSIIDWFPMEKFLFIWAAIVAVSKGWGGYIELVVTGSGIDPWWSINPPRFPFPEVSALANCFLSLWACLSIGLDQVTSTRQSSRTSLSLVAS